MAKVLVKLKPFHIIPYFLFFLTLKQKKKCCLNTVETKVWPYNTSGSLLRQPNNLLVNS